MSELGRKLAQPGDPDLVFDMQGMTVRSVLVLGREIIVGFTHGYGFWVDDVTGERVEIPPGDTSAETEGELVVTLERATQGMFDFMVRQLEDWVERGVPLRVCVAPDRCSTMIENNKRWLPLPWKPHPEV